MSNEKTPLKKDTTKVDNLYVIDGINGNWEKVDSFKDAWDYIKETAMEGSEIHPDAESIFVVQQVAFLHVEETTERMEIDGDEMPVCKVDLIRNTHHKDSPTPLSAVDILMKYKTSSSYKTHLIVGAMEEYAAQQTAQLRQKVDVLEKNILAATDREEQYTKTFSEIANVCGTVNFSSHNQMKESIQTAIELSEQHINKE